MTMRSVWTLAICLVSACLVDAPAAAQETREEIAARERDEKRQHVEPYTPGKIERALFLIEDQFLIQRVFDAPRGFFVRWGGLPEGSSVGAGPAYRYSTQSWSFTASGAISVRMSRQIDVRLSFPPVKPMPTKAIMSVGFQHRFLPGEDFWGVGNDTAANHRSVYLIQHNAVDTNASVNVTDWFSVGGALEYFTPELADGTDRTFPPVDFFFSDATAPGLDNQPDYLRSGARATLDYTNRDDGTLIGGRYTLSFDNYSDRDLKRYSFNRWDLDLQQYVPIVTSARSVVLRAHVASTTAAEGDQVPFYLMPALGGSHSIRSLRVYRLRDLHSLLLQGEYRWDINPFLTGVLFYDTAKVANRRTDLDFHGLRDSYGFGLRLGFMNNLAMRAEIVLGGDEGRVIALRFGDVF